MPYSQGQPKRRRGNHPVVGDMRKRVAGDRRAQGGGCVILIIVGAAVAASAAVVMGYFIMQVVS